LQAVRLAPRHPPYQAKKWLARSTPLSSYPARRFYGMECRHLQARAMRQKRGRAHDQQKLGVAGRHDAGNSLQFAGAIECRRQQDDPRREGRHHDERPPGAQKHAGLRAALRRREDRKLDRGRSRDRRRRIVSVAPDAMVNW